MNINLAKLFCSLDNSLQFHEKTVGLRMDDVRNGVKQEKVYGVICDDLITISNIILNNMEEFNAIDSSGCSLYDECLDYDEVEDGYFVY